MAVLKRDDLKIYFKKGAKPKSFEFGDLIDSCYNVVEDNVQISGWIFNKLRDDIDNDINNGGRMFIPVPAFARTLNSFRLTFKSNTSGISNATYSLLYLSDISSLDGTPGQPHIPDLIFYYNLIGRF